MADNVHTIADAFTFLGFIRQADPLIRFILGVLVVMSLASWFVILNKAWDQRQIGKAYGEAHRKFWAAGNLQNGMAAVTGKDNVFRMMAEDGIKAAQYHEGHMTQQVSLNEWIMVCLQRSAESVMNRLARGLAILATVGSVSPFVGLLGTVWGIFNALRRISVTGQAPLEEIAGPIGESLIMTAIGLFVAVPAVMGYNWLLRRNRTINESLRRFAADVHSSIVGGARFDMEAPLVKAVPARAVAGKGG